MLMRRDSILITSILLNLVTVQNLPAQDKVRVATYNIQFLSTKVVEQGDRLDKLKQVVTKLDADIIALQEVADRAAVELVFDKSAWSVVIDDESTDEQDLAVVVRKPFFPVGIDPDLDADDRHFIGAGLEDEYAFPNRRDGLIVEVALPGTSSTLSVISMHSKSRLGGRDVTDPRREAAAGILVDRLKSRFAGRNFVLLGDFNDNPDDRSLNILETGSKETSGGKEELDGPFLVNLAEPLVAMDYVSHGASEARLEQSTGLLDIAISGSRERNDKNRGRGINTGPILFDQLLIPMQMKESVVTSSTAIFRDPVALRGPGQTRASDHLPSWSDFIISELPASDALTTSADCLAIDQTTSTASQP